MHHVSDVEFPAVAFSLSHVCFCTPWSINQGRSFDGSGLIQPAIFSPCWCDIQTLDPRVPLNTSAVNSEVLQRLIQSRWSTGPSRCSCCSRQTDGISVWGLERFSTDLGANDTSICRGLSPIMVMEGRLRRLSYHLVGDLHIWTWKHLLCHFARCDTYIGLETEWRQGSLRLIFDGPWRPCRSVKISFSPWEPNLFWHDGRFVAQLQEEKRCAEAPPHWGSSPRMLIFGTFQVAKIPRIFQVSGISRNASRYKGR